MVEGKIDVREIREPSRREKKGVLDTISVPTPMIYDNGKKNTYAALQMRDMREGSKARCYATKKERKKKKNS